MPSVYDFTRGRLYAPASSSHIPHLPRRRRHYATPQCVSRLLRVHAAAFVSPLLTPLPYVAATKSHAAGVGAAAERRVRSPAHKSADAARRHVLRRDAVGTCRYDDAAAMMRVCCAE